MLAHLIVACAALVAFFSKKYVLPGCRAARRRFFFFLPHLNMRKTVAPQSVSKQRCLAFRGAMLFPKQHAFRLGEIIAFQDGPSNSFFCVVPCRFPKVTDFA